ncbi:MAG: hypothetical protein QM760_18700 [Nibricoccus sp.]
MNFSAIVAAPDSSLLEKSFIALGEKLGRLRGFCNRWNCASCINFPELNMSQLREFLRAFLRKFLATTTPFLKVPDRGEPVGAGWLMNTIDFVADGRGLESDFAHEVKKRAGSRCFLMRPEEKAWLDVQSGRAAAGVGAEL